MIEWRLDFMNKLVNGLRLCDVHFWQTAAAEVLEKHLRRVLWPGYGFLIRVASVQWNIKANFHHKSDKKNHRKLWGSTRSSLQADFLCLDQVQ